MHFEMLFYYMVTRDRTFFFNKIYKFESSVIFLGEGNELTVWSEDAGCCRREDDSRSRCKSLFSQHVYLLSECLLCFHWTSSTVLATLCFAIYTHF